MDADEIVAQIEEVFGGIEGFLEDEAVQAAIDDSIQQVLGVADGDVEYAEKQTRPDVLHGVTQRIDTGYGKLYVNINEDPEADRPFELFANIGNSGGFTASFTEALAKTISTALRSGVDPEEIADELQGIRRRKSHGTKASRSQHPGRYRHRDASLPRRRNRQGLPATADHTRGSRRGSWRRDRHPTRPTAARPPQLTRVATCRTSSTPARVRSVPTVET